MLVGSIDDSLVGELFMITNNSLVAWFPSSYACSTSFRILIFCTLKSTFTFWLFIMLGNSSCLRGLLDGFVRNSSSLFRTLCYTFLSLKYLQGQAFGAVIEMSESCTWMLGDKSQLCFCFCLLVKVHPGKQEMVMTWIVACLLAMWETCIEITLNSWFQPDLALAVLGN